MAIDLSFGGTAFPRALEVRKYLYSSGSSGISPRFRYLNALDSYYRCREYEGLKRTWDGREIRDNAETLSPLAPTPFGFTQPAAEIPLAARRPSVTLRLTPLIVNNFTDLLFTQQRSPKIVVEDDPDSEDFLRAVIEKAKFFRTMTEARNMGGSMGSALVTVHLRDGRFVFKAHSPKTVHDVVWQDADLRILEGVLIQYVYFEGREMLDAKTGVPTGQIKQVPFLFRRIIDTEMDITFLPAEIKGAEVPNPEVDLQKSFAHGLGRFPGFWIQNIPNSEDLDGLSDVEGLHENMEALDRQLSQSNSGLLKNQDPTLVISRDRKNVQYGIPLQKGSDNALEVGIQGSATYLEIGAAGISAAREFVQEGKTQVLAVAGAVVPDPEKISGAAQSAKAIEFIFAPMLAKADKLRTQYGEAIIELMGLVLLLARKFADPTRYTGNVQPKFDLPDRVNENDIRVRRHPGAGERVTLKWGPYFSRTPTDVQGEIGTIAVALSGGLIDRETAVRMACEVMDIEDWQAVYDKVLADLERQSAIASDYQDGFYPEGQEVPEEGLEGESGLEEQPLPVKQPVVEGVPAEQPVEQPASNVVPMVEPEKSISRVAATPEIEAQANALLARHSGMANRPAGEVDPKLDRLLAQQGAKDYNGAQMASVLEIVRDVTNKAIPRESGIAMLVFLIGLSSEAAEAVLSSAGETFEPEESEPEWGGGGGGGYGR